MSELTDRLRREKSMMLDRPLVTRGQRLVVAMELHTAADALDAAEAKLAAIAAAAEAAGVSVDRYLEAAQRLWTAEKVQRGRHFGTGLTYEDGDADGQNRRLAALRGDDQ